VCTFGDASLNHSTSQGALNAAAQAAHRGVPLPLLFVCEDNGLGISVPTPAGWVAASLSSRPSLPYLFADGADPLAVFEAVEELADLVRTERRPAVLHLRTVRFGGHAGTDVEAAYRPAVAIRADRERDPIVGTARLLVRSGLTTAAQLCDRTLASRAAVRARAESPRSPADPRLRLGSPSPCRSTGRSAACSPTTRGCSSSARTSASRVACTA
jgi:2-oxoisovalerate dehydrogenase E1 component